jgi:drug/metabolite transporter (DMT)-like permease
MNTTLAIPSKLELRAAALVALSATLYGFLGYLGTKLLQQHFSVPSMLFWRFFIAALWMILVVMFSKKEKLLLMTKQSTLFKALALGAICYSGCSAFYFLASRHIGTGPAMVIFFTYPVFVVSLAWIIEKHVVSKYTAAALIAIIVGLILMKGTGFAALNKAGIFFAVIAALFYGLYMYSSKHVIKSVSPCKLTILVCLSCALVFLVFAYSDHSFVYPTSLKSWLYVCAFGVIATALPIQLLLEGLKYIHPNKASILSVLEPLVTFIVGIIMLGETTSTLQTTGAFIILLSAILIQCER